MTKRVSLIIFFAICLAIVSVYRSFFDKPAKDVLLPAINVAFEYYRKGSVKKPWASVYFIENAEEHVKYEPLPQELAIPDSFTIDCFTLKRPSASVIAMVPLDGYIAYCKIEYLESYFMESLPPPAWQVVTVEFEPIG